MLISHKCMFVHTSVSMNVCVYANCIYEVLSSGSLYMQDFSDLAVIS